jgi:putative membrane protein
MKILINWFLSAISLLLSTWLIPGVHVSGLFSALLAVVILGAVNAIIRPILIILTLPINVLTLGLFTLVINALMIALTAYILPGFSIANFGIAIIFSIILTIITEIMESLIKEKVTPKK